MNKLLVGFILSCCFLIISCVPVKKYNVKTDDEQFASFVEQQLTVAQSNKQVYHLKVNAVPSNSVIKVMNIKPKYRHNMSLYPGKYDVLVQNNGYKPKRQWIEIRDRDVTINVTLQKAMKSLYRKALGRYKTESRQKKVGKLGCSPRKSCGTVVSCEEAYYHLRNCGNKRMDRDKDGVPCESICIE